MANTKTSSKMDMKGGMGCMCGCCCGPKIIVGMVLAAILGPLLFIWSLNTLFLGTLFSAAIPYTIFTWFAALIIVALLMSGRGMKRWRMGCNCTQCSCGMGMYQKK